MNGEMKNAYKVVISKPEWEIPVGRCKYRGKDNIKV
jgi:hypothetical protein